MWLGSSVCVGVRACVRVCVNRLSIFYQNKEAQHLTRTDYVNDVLAAPIHLGFEVCVRACGFVHGCVLVAIRFELIPFLQLAALQAFGHHTVSDGQNIYLFNASFQLEQIFQLIVIAAKDYAQSFILIIDNNRITFYFILFFFILLWWPGCFKVQQESLLVRRVINKPVVQPDCQNRCILLQVQKLLHTLSKVFRHCAHMETVHTTAAATRLRWKLILEFFL